MKLTIERTVIYRPITGPELRLHLASMDVLTASRHDLVYRPAANEWTEAACDTTIADIIALFAKKDRTPEEQFHLQLWIHATTWATFLASLHRIESRERDDEAADWVACGIPEEWRNPGDFLTSMTQAMALDLFQVALECNPNINVPTTDEEKKIGLISVS